jgi:carbon starvation protein
MLGKIYAPFGRTDWLPGNLLASFVIVLAWAYFIYTGSVSSIWPMFGTANQLLAAIALTVGTSFIINRGKARYAWVTILPLIFIAITTLVAGAMNSVNIFAPMIFVPKTQVQGIINLFLTIVIMASVIVVMADAVPKWIAVIRRTNDEHMGIGVRGVEAQSD